tara:strand:+ start:1100 stop:1255 length:156 start_codon:yes stop_codon:yes gene_type:complete
MIKNKTGLVPSVLKNRRNCESIEKFSFFLLGGWAHRRQAAGYKLDISHKII